MLRHVVMFRRKRDVAKDDALELSLVDRMAALGQQIPGIRAWRVGVNELEGPISWGYVLESEADDVAALQGYLVHPLHKAVLKDSRSYFEWAAVDFTV